MKIYISEGRAMYEDENHGLFSQKLAEWAIKNMQVTDTATKELKPLKTHSIEDMKETLKAAAVDLPEEFMYTAWYLYNMAFADYPKTLATDEQRAMFIKETICDPDCCPEAVLETFVVKMQLMGKPIFWEKFL
jgi:hypothetical protein